MKSFLLLCCLAFVCVMPLRADTPKESYQKHIEEDLDSLSAKIQDLRRRSEKAGTETRAKLDRQVEALENKLGLAEKKLGKVKGQTNDSWEKFRAGLDQAIDDLKKSYQKTAARFK